MTETTNANQSNEIAKANLPRTFKAASERGKIAKARERYLEARRNCQETNLAVLQTMLEYLEAYKRYGFAQLVDYEAEATERQARGEYHELVPHRRVKPKGK